MHFGLERMHRLTTTLGMPQRRFASVHVVGSNGKLSTVRFTAAVLERHGLRTGSYTSPHLASFRERIEVGEEPVSGERFAAAVERAAKAAEIVERAQAADDDAVTQFEALTAAAYHELAARKVEVAVIEAGLGGRFDATNVIPSKVTVLTGVGLEHTRWLGPTIADIAEEKLAVVRDHSALVTGPLEPEALAVAERVAGGAPRALGPFARPCRGPAARRGSVSAPEFRPGMCRRRGVPGSPAGPRRGGRRRGRDAHPRRAPGPGRREAAGAARRRPQPGRSARPGAGAAGGPGRPPATRAGWRACWRTRTPRPCCRRCWTSSTRWCSRAARTRARCRRPRWSRWRHAPQGVRAPGGVRTVPDPRAAVRAAQELAGPEGRGGGHGIDRPPDRRPGAPRRGRARLDDVGAVVAITPDPWHLSANGSRRRTPLRRDDRPCGPGGGRRDPAVLRHRLPAGNLFLEVDPSLASAGFGGVWARLASSTRLRRCSCIDYAVRTRQPRPATRRFPPDLSNGSTRPVGGSTSRARR